MYMYRGIHHVSSVRLWCVCAPIRMCTCVQVCEKARLTVSENSKLFHISFSISGGESYCVLIREKDEIIKAIPQSTESAYISMLSLHSHFSFFPPSDFCLPSPFLFIPPFFFFSKPVCLTFTLLSYSLTVLSVSFYQFASDLLWYLSFFLSRIIIKKN